MELVAFFPIYTGLAIVTLIGSGWALDKFGAARLMPYYQLPLVVSFIAFSYAVGPMGIFIGFLFMALTSGANNTLPNAFWAECYGTAHIGAIKAMITAVMVLGSAIGPGITGLFIDLGLGLETQFMWIAGYFLLTTALMFIGITRARA
jgi:MFS family permease